MDFLTFLKEEREEKRIPEIIYQIFLHLYHAYVETLTSARYDYSEHEKIFYTYVDLVKKQIASPHKFEPFHKKITEPFDHQHFGIDLFTPMVDKKKSRLLYLENIDKMLKQLDAQENVILLANHQTEVDPQLIKIALSDSYPKFASDLIFVAGDRVITDPIAVPLSLGCDLICIYSKRYIDNPPEKKEEKQLHNQRTMKRMGQLLAEGGKAIYVAPSGGRDRVNEKGELMLSPFDPQSIEMFRLMARQSKRPTHFYPLALKTYDILPPPQVVQTELGEKRLPNRRGVYFAFGDEIDMENFPGSDACHDRHAKRGVRSDYIFNLVQTHYNEFS